MSKGNSVELNLASDGNHLHQPLRSHESDFLNTQRERLVAVDSYPLPDDFLHPDDDSDLSLVNDSKKLLGKYQFSYEPGLPRSHATIDLLVTMFCFAAMHSIYLGSLDFSTHRTIALLSSLVFVVLSLSAGGLYSTKRLRSLNRELTTLGLCWLCAFAAIGLFAFLTKTAAEVSRFWITTSMLLSLISLAGVRFLACWGLIPGKTARTRNVIVCGDVRSIRSLMHNLQSAANSRVQVARVFQFSSHQSIEPRSSGSLKRSSQQIIKFVEKRRQSGVAIEQVWVAVSADQSSIVEELSRALIDSPVDVCVVPDDYTERLLKGEISRYGDTRVVNVSETSLPPAADQFKRIFDVFLASAGLLVLCIPMAIIACLIKLETPGPAFFRQKRYGVDGTEIEILKFRSMAVHADTLVRQATRNDTRVTRLGRILRRTSLDELPQLINVLKGTMSLVGPRPHAVAHNEIWRKQIEGYMLRHKVRPGITGWAQVHGWRGETDTAYKMQQRVRFDLEYIRNWSPWLDVKIIALTVIKGFRHKNAY